MTELMYFSNNAIQQLQKERSQIIRKYQTLAEICVSRNYKNSIAQEYATHGFSRRVKTLVRCIDNTYRTLPPDLVVLPTNDDLSDAEIYIQAFVFNVFGAIDNLAWIWVLEKAVSKDDGSPIPKQLVGLSKKYKLVRGSFPIGFQEYLNSLDSWFAHLENFRHALAHRIPLYIPPYTVIKDNLAAYYQLERRKAESIKHLNWAEHERLSAEQRELAVLVPCITHSFEEEAIPVIFHYQLLADFKTIESLAQKMLKELDA
jgi:hypothetical protein